MPKKNYDYEKQISILRAKPEIVIAPAKVLTEKFPTANFFEENCLKIKIVDSIAQKDLLETQQIVFLIERISYYIKEVKLASNQHLWLEVGMIDLANMTENSTLLDLQNRVRALETGDRITSSVSIPTQTPQVVTKPAPIQPPQPEPISAPTAKVESVQPKFEEKKQDMFTPPPISKKSDGNDLASLWQMLLMNIKSPSTTALLKLATPLQISPDGVVLTFKNDRLVAQLSDSNKKQLIVDAANTMFNQINIPVTVRLAQSGDKAVQPNVAIEIKQKPEIEPQPVIKKEIKEVSNTEQEISEDTNIEKARLESDQEKMVMDLFDGKYVE